MQSRSFKFAIFGLGAAFWIFSGQSALAAADNISQINFFTPPRAVAPAAVSEVITIQTQNAAGEEEKLSETADLELTSSSPTGEFSSSASTWKAVNKLTMSKNSAKRNFYYQDSAAGSHIITAKTTTRETQRSWQAAQEIAVGDDVEPPPPPGEEKESSAVSPPGKQKTETAPSAFKAEIRRPALVPVDSPVSFQAKVSGAKKGDLLRLQWSFGDGGTTLGRDIFHTYRFPGEYIVVLNAAGGDEKVTVRTTVKVIQPEIVISEVLPAGAAGGHIQLENRAGSEINLGGFSLTAAGQFVFPPDTILGAKSKLNLPLETTRLRPAAEETLTLFSPLGRPVASYGPATPKTGAISSAEELAVISEEVRRLETALGKLQSAPALPRPAVLPAKPPATIPPLSAASEAVNDPAPAVIEFELPKPAGFWSRGFALVKNLFQ